MRARAVYGRVWFIGDSLTAGYDAESAQASFPAVAAAALAAMRPGSAANVLNANQYGGRVADGIRQALADLSFLPDLVVLQLGENDRPWSLAFTAAYAILIEQLHREGRRPLVAACSVWDPNADEDYALMSADIEGLVTAAGGVFVPLTAACEDPANRQAGRDVSWLNDPEHTVSDDFHPNDAGHAAIARALVAALGPRVLEGPGRLPAQGRKTAAERSLR